MKLIFEPSIDDLFNVESDVDFRQILTNADKMMDGGDVDGACQLRLDTAIEALEAIEELDNDELELDMNNPDNHPLIELLVASGLDNFYICDFELSATLLETAMMLDTEDHFGAINTLAYCYAALEEFEALEEINDLTQFSRLEQEFIDIFKKFMAGKKTNPSENLKNELTNQESDLFNRTNHLLLHFENLKTIF